MENNNGSNDQNVQPQYQPVQPADYQQPVQYAQPVQPAEYMQPAQNQQPVQYPAPYFEGTAQEMKERNKKANILCIISLVLRVAPYVLTTITGTFNRLFENVDLSSISQMSNMATLAISAATSGTYIASWVLVIIAKVKFKESKFAKILLIIYICELVLTVIAVVVLVIWCMVACRNFPG